MIVLATPEFLYRFTAPPDDAAPGSVYAVDQYGLASRLSFFLWSSVPDDELLGLAERGELDDPRVISAQVERMLADPRAAALVTNFAQQWLDIRGIRDIVPDPVLFPEYDPNLGDAFARELELFLASVLLEDRSVLELLNAQAHVLERAARAALRRAGRARRQLPPRRARRRESLGPVRQGRHLDGDVVPEPHGARAARRVDPRSDHGHAARVAAAGRRGVPRDAGRRAADDGSRAARDAPRESELQRLPRRHGPARLRAREFRRDRRVARQGSRGRRRDRLVGPARRRHRRRRARRLA